MIPQSTINACVKAWYGTNENTDYGKIQAVLMAYESLRPTPPTAIPDGMVVVPAVPTNAMCEASRGLFDRWHECDAAEIYKAMIAAAPGSAEGE